jgi:hypothetical protein
MVVWFLLPLGLWLGEMQAGAPRGPSLHMVHQAPSWTWPAG